MSQGGEVLNWFYILPWAPLQGPALGATWGGPSDPTTAQREGAAARTLISSQKGPQGGTLPLRLYLISSMSFELPAF